MLFCDKMKRGCVSAEEYEAVFVLSDLVIFLRDLVKGEIEEDPQYLEYLVSEICRTRDEVYDKRVV